MSDLLQNTNSGINQSNNKFFLQDPSVLWEGLSQLTQSISVAEFETSLEQALRAGKLLTGADILAIYKADNLSPGLIRIVEIGETISLPEKLPPQDLMQLRKPYIWLHDKRPISTLHLHLIQSDQVGYIATTPIGQSNAMIGLVVIAGKQVDLPASLGQFLKIFSLAITTIIEGHSLRDQVEIVSRDANQQQKINEALEQHIQEGFLLLNPLYEIIKINLMAEMMLGYSEKEVLGQPVDKILIATEPLAPALALISKGSENINLENLRLYRRNGESFITVIRMSPVYREGNLESIIILIHDLSEQEKMRAHAQQLERIALLGEVTAIFAHEVRNPINNISTGLQLMALNLAEHDPNQGAISRMVQDCERLSGLMKSVLSFAKTTDYEMEIIDIRMLIKRLIDRLETRINRENLQFNLQKPKDCPQIRGNARALEQVFNNLINNALQAMSENGGQLAIKIQSTITDDGRDYVEVSVADTGPGIPKEIQDRIFQPFFTTERSGTGLGLAIAKRIITAHNGYIRLESIPGATVFHVLIPAIEPSK